ncbi:MAG: hypothetical protein PVI03_06675 [Candidatus Thorarchaeota archaeon]|jgi:hypothetical protein
MDSERTGEMSEILSRVSLIWFKNSQLRLCQLIGNCFDAGDFYHKTDKELLEGLKKIYPMKLHEEKDVDEMVKGMVEE